MKCLGRYRASYSIILLILSGRGSLVSRSSGWCVLLRPLRRVIGSLKLFSFFLCFSLSIIELLRGSSTLDLENWLTGNFCSENFGYIFSELPKFLSVEKLISSGFILLSSLGLLFVVMVVIDPATSFLFFFIFFSLLGNYFRYVIPDIHLSLSYLFSALRTNCLSLAIN